MPASVIPQQLLCYYYGNYYVITTSGYHIMVYVHYTSSPHVINVPGSFDFTRIIRMIIKCN